MTPTKMLGTLIAVICLLYGINFFFQNRRVPGALGYFIVTNKEITRYSKASVFAFVGKKTPIKVRFSVAGPSMPGMAETQRSVYAGYLVFLIYYYNILEHRQKTFLKVYL